METTTVGIRVLVKEEDVPAVKARLQRVLDEAEAEIPGGVGGEITVEPAPDPGTDDAEA